MIIIKYIIFFILHIYCNKKNISHQQVYKARIPTVFLNKLLNYLRDVDNGKKSYMEYGICSYYHNKFHRRKTATGDEFDQKIWTGAHKTLPIPSIILVCFLDKKELKAMIILLNDRGPYIEKRILDISYSGAQNLGIIKSGYKKVVIFFLKYETMELYRKSKRGQKYIPPYLGILNQKQIIAILKKNYIYLS